MKSVKKIIWLVWDFWFFEKNKKSFELLWLLVLKIDWENWKEDLKKCDWIFFWTSSYFQLKNLYSEKFFEKILEKIENNFPVFLSWQSVNIFLDKIWTYWEFGENFLEKKWKILNYNWEIFLDFLDSKKIKIKIFKNFFYQEKKIRFWQKFLFFLKKIFWKNNNIKNIWLKKFWKFWEDWHFSVYTYKKTLFTIFSPECYWNERIFEYFINNFY